MDNMIKKATIFSLATPESNPQELAICPVCGEPIEAFYTDREGHRLTFQGKNVRYRKCACERAKDEIKELRCKQAEHIANVERLSGLCFSGNYAMKKMTFAESDIDNQVITLCKAFVKEWEKIKEENLGLIFWGDIGTGKSYMAACIANALLEKEVSVKMLNPSDVMNAAFESREELLRDIRQYSLLIIDDFGMERDTEYGNEITFQVIDARYQSRKPLIVTTNLSLNTLNSPQDISHKRIYDRILEMCSPVHFDGSGLRQEIRKDKKNRIGNILGIEKEGDT